MPGRGANLRRAVAARRATSGLCARSLMTWKSTLIGQAGDPAFVTNESAISTDLSLEDVLRTFREGVRVVRGLETECISSQQSFQQVPPLWQDTEHLGPGPRHVPEHGHHRRRAFPLKQSG